MLAGCDGCENPLSCSKEEEPEAVEIPNPGGATQDIVATQIGNGLGLHANLAPTATAWSRVIVVDDSTAVIFGRVLDEVIALRTTDRARTWTSHRVEVDKWAMFGAGPEGALALLTGPPAKAATAGGVGPLEKVQVRFVPPEATISEAALLFDDKEPLPRIKTTGAIPAVLSKELAAMVVSTGRNQTLIYGVPGGMQQPAPKQLPGTGFVTAPYGNPAQLLQRGRGTLSVRPWPAPDAELATPVNVDGYRAGREAEEQLDAGPSCDHGAWSFVRVTNGAASAAALGISPDKQAFVPLPKGAEANLGCGPDAVVAEAFDEEKKEPQLYRCTVAEAKCSEPKSHPFEIWPVEHDRKILTTATKEGVIAVMSAKAGARWGVYVAVSQDGGESFELPRVVGEGDSDRGYMELGALIGFGDRTIVLLSADVTGTRRRGWYVLATNDGGATWGPP